MNARRGKEADATESVCVDVEDVLRLRFTDDAGIVEGKEVAPGSVPDFDARGRLVVIERPGTRRNHAEGANVTTLAAA